LDEMVKFYSSLTISFEFVSEITIALNLLTKSFLVFYGLIRLNKLIIIVTHRDMWFAPKE